MKRIILFLAFLSVCLNSFAQKSKLKEQKQEYEKRIEQNPDDAEAHYSLADVLRKLNNKVSISAN